MGGTPSIRAALRACVADETPMLSLQVGFSPQMQQRLRTDAEIDRLLQTLFNN
jgi:hypothetical protein